MFKKFTNSKRFIRGLQIPDYLIILAGLSIFAILTFWTISKSSIWFDEAFGAYLIRFNFVDIARYTAADVHPPLFYWLLKLWSMLFGTSELALRSMSVLFGGIAIIFGYLLANRLFSQKMARISLIFMVLSPMLVRYSQEARMYTLMTAIALAATYVLSIAMTTKRRLPWIIYGILVAMGMWTHYFTAIIWIAHWIWRADAIRRIASKKTFVKLFFSKQWIMAHVVAVALFIPWLPFFVSQMFTVQAFGFWIPPVTPVTILNFLTNVFYYQDVGNVIGWLSAGFLVAITFISVIAFRIYKLLNEAERQSYRLIISLAFVPMLILFLLSMPPLRSSFIDRYLIPSTIGIAIFIGTTLGFGFKLLRPKGQIIATIFIVGLMGIGIFNVWQMGNYNKNSRASNNTKQIIEAAIAKSSGNQPIIAATPWLFYEAVFYATESHPIYFIDADEYLFGSLKMLKENDQFKIKDINAFAVDNPVVWYVGYSNEGKLDAPYSNWRPIVEVSINDSVSNGPAYKAIQYEISK